MASWTQQRNGAAHMGKKQSYLLPSCCLSYGEVVCYDHHVLLIKNSATTNVPFWRLSSADRHLHFITDSNMLHSFASQVQKISLEVRKGTVTYIMVMDRTCSVGWQICINSWPETLCGFTGAVLPWFLRFWSLILCLIACIWPYKLSFTHLLKRRTLD